MTPRSLRRALPAALLAVLPLSAVLSGCDTEDDTGAETTVTVMTRNLYLGADLFTLLDPACSADPIAFPTCVNELYLEGVVTSDPQGRMAAIADEIEANDPDLVGLQEVSLYRRQDESDYVTGITEPNAADTTYDFLGLLLEELEDRGLDYEVAAQNENADVEFPALGSASFYDVRLTDRDVILARAGLSTTVLAEENFDDNLPIVIAGATVEFTRGYSAVSVTQEGVDFTFANTHLEVGGSAEAAAFQRLQAGFLASSNGLGDEDPLILVGDFNANPDTEPDPVLLDAYDLLVAEFEDAWADLRDDEVGYTCCHDADLQNDDPTLTERIDLILYQGQVTPISTGRVGEESEDITAAGLWPSDHAGVVATLRVTE